jgi:hypothetical protein
MENYQKLEKVGEGMSSFCSVFLLILSRKR